MSLAEAIQKERPKRSGQRMRVDVVMGELNDADREAFVAALNDTTLSPRKLAKALHANGTKCSENAVTNWRVEHGIG